MAWSTVHPCGGLTTPGARTSPKTNTSIRLVVYCWAGSATRARFPMGLSILGLGTYIQKPGCGAWFVVQPPIPKVRMANILMRVLGLMDRNGNAGCDHGGSETADTPPDGVPAVA